MVKLFLSTPVETNSGFNTSFIATYFGNCLHISETIGGLQSLYLQLAPSTLDVGSIVVRTNKKETLHEHILTSAQNTT